MNTPVVTAMLLVLATSCSSCSSGSSADATTSTAPTASAPTTSALPVVTVATVAPTSVAITTTTAAPATTAVPTTVAPTVAPTTTTTTTPPTVPPLTEAPTTTVDPLLLARGTFRAITATATGAGNAVAAAHPLTDWSSYPAYCAEMAVVARTFADAMSAASWPAGAATQATDLSAGHTYLAALYDQCAATDGEYDQLVPIEESLRAVHGYVSAANVAMRVAIGFRADR